MRGICLLLGSNYSASSLLLALLICLFEAAKKQPRSRLQYGYADGRESLVKGSRLRVDG